jgi:SAM-dependent methyltransferase
VNKHHAQVCPTPEWAEYLQTEVLPRLTRDVDLGTRMIEIGPGPGAATDFFHRRVQTLTAVEIEAEAAAKLAERFAGTGVEVVHHDATDLPFPADSFDSAGCFTMLHHVPTVALQNRILSEVLRVLKPGGVLLGSDSLPSDTLHRFHEDDIYNPVEPSTLFVRLQTLGYDRISINTGKDNRMAFSAYKPA